MFTKLGKLSRNNKYLLAIVIVIVLLAAILIPIFLTKESKESFQSIEYVEDSMDGPDGEYVYSQLTEKKPDLIPKRDEIIIGLFYANWCPHCVHFKPTFKKVGDMWKDPSKRTINNKRLRFVEIDCEVLADLAAKYKVQGYPTIKIIDQDRDVEYTGSRDEHDFAKYLETL